MASVSIDQVKKRFGSTEILHGVDIAIDDGSFTVLVGPSGCGKSTLLRMIAGLEQISDGEIRIGERRVNDLPPKERDIAMVFQNYALYPHMTVRRNMAFSLMLAKRPQAEIDQKVERAAQTLALTPLLDRYPRQLSGGQRQRVAMGRAIVRDPQVFLFDEPLSNLDAKLRVAMRSEIKELHQRLGTTSVYVTHDQIEAMTMGDKIVVMQDGRIEQTGSPLELYDRPANLFVAGFIGSPAMNFLPGTLRQAGGAARVEFADGTHLRGAGARRCARRPAGRDRHAPRTPDTGRRRRDAATSSIEAQVVVVEPTGAETLVMCRHAGTELAAVFRERHDFAPGSTIRLQPDLQRAHLFDADSGRRLCRLSLLRRLLFPSRTHTPRRHAMNEFDRRKFLEGSAGIAGAATLGIGGALWAPGAAAQNLSFQPEKGAKLRVLRWSRFVQGDIDAYMVNVKKFTEKTGVEVRVDNEGWEDVRPKAAVAANTGAGPDIILSHQRRRQPVPGQAARRDRPGRVPRQEVRPLVCRCRGLPAPGRQEVDRHPARRVRLDDGLPREHGEGGRLRQLPQGHRRLPEDDEGAARQGHARRHGARQRDRRRPVVQLADLGLRRPAGRQEQQGGDRQPGDAQGARVRQGAVRHLHPRHAVVARPEQQQGLPRRPGQRHQQRHLDLLRGQEFARIRRSRRWRPTSSTPRSRSVRSACRPSRTCSSTRW